MTDLSTLTRQIAHDRRQDHMTIMVWQTFGHAVAHGSHQGMGSTQIDAHSDSTLVRVRGLARLRNL
jgi:hypothetical protein